MNARNLPKFALSLENIVISAWLYRKKMMEKRKKNLSHKLNLAAIYGNDYMCIVLCLCGTKYFAKMLVILYKLSWGSDW